MIKISLAIAAGVLLAASPVLAHSPHKHRGMGPRWAKSMHRARSRRTWDSGLSIVSVGSNVKITSSGEVIVPPTTIVVARPLPPTAAAERIKAKPPLPTAPAAPATPPAQP